MFTFASFSTSAPAQIIGTQIKLSENQIQSFIAAQDDMSLLVEQMDAGSLEQANTEYDAKLDAITKKHGFKNLAEFDRVATNVSIIMAGIDPETKVFTEPQLAIKKEIEDVSADKSISPREKSEMLEQLNEAFKAAEPTRFPSNIELVKKHYDKLEVMNIGNPEDDSRPVPSADAIGEAK
jgi:hypothetical protein